MAANDFLIGNHTVDLSANVVASDQFRGGISQRSFPSHQIAHKRTFSKADSASDLKRSASTPDVQSLRGGESPNMSAAEKRRNKLGYHRTSIACSHCRRRKIRCLLDEKDPHGRCQNCIRLKKECNFYPVDQQPPTAAERRPRASSRTEASSTDADVSSTSSPGKTSGNVEQVEKFPQNPFGTPRAEAGWNPAFGTSAASPGLLGGGFASRDASHGLEGNSPWDSPTYYAQSPVQLGNSSRPRPEENSGLFSPTGNPFMQSQYSVTPAVPSNSDPRSTSNFAVSSAADESSWARTNPHLGVRSMSMIGHDELPSQYQNYQYSTLPNADLKRRPTNMSDIQPAPSLQGSGAASSGSTTDSFGTPNFPAYRGQPIPQAASYAAYQGWSAYPDPQQGATGVSGGYGSGLYDGTAQTQHHFDHMGQYKDDATQYRNLPNSYSGPG